MIFGAGNPDSRRARLTGAEDFIAALQLVQLGGSGKFGKCDDNYVGVGNIDA